MSPDSNNVVVFIGGGNMASALIGGLLKNGRAPGSVRVVEPFEAQRDKLAKGFGVRAQPAADASLAGAALVVWAVKPQLFTEAAAQPNAFYERSARSLKRVGDKLVAWQKAPAHRDVVKRLQAQLDGVCRALPETDGQRSTCDGLLKPGRPAG